MWMEVDIYSVKAKSQVSVNMTTTEKDQSRKKSS